VSGVTKDEFQKSVNPLNCICKVLTLYGRLNRKPLVLSPIYLSLS